ncbi:MAG: carboxypeptidase-like regulatory domain-containing protein [Terracidiphilus sp.]
MNLSLQFARTITVAAAMFVPWCAGRAQQFVPSSTLPDAPAPVSLNSSEAKPIDDSSSPATAPKKAGLTGEAANISGTVLDVNGDLVPGATVIVTDPQSGEHREAVANDTAAFVFTDLAPGVPYNLTVKAQGFADWTSGPIVLTPGQYDFLTDVRIKILAESSSVTVYASTEQIAAEQVRLAEQQRVLGIIPNFYVVYDAKNAVPLTTKLKFKLALKVSTDPVTIAGVAGMAAINQAANRPDFAQGAKGYGQRFGVVAADAETDILIGGAILPSLLHQDPRYFYQGTGTTSSRLRHAMFSPFICRGDNGQLQPNYSSLGGDLAASALSNAYYPQSNRGVSLVFGTFAIGTAERMLSGFAQEFILPRFTPGLAKNKKDAH